MNKKDLRLEEIMVLGEFSRKMITVLLEDTRDVLPIDYEMFDKICITDREDKVERMQRECRNLVELVEREYSCDFEDMDKETIFDWYFRFTKRLVLGTGKTVGLWNFKEINEEEKNTIAERLRAINLPSIVDNI